MDWWRAAGPVGSPYGSRGTHDWGLSSTIAFVG
jgi:hypothetical protein